MLRERIQEVTDDADGDTGKQHQQQLWLFLPTNEKVKYSKSNQIKHVAAIDRCTTFFIFTIFFTIFSPAGNIMSLQITEESRLPYLNLFNGLNKQVTFWMANIFANEIEICMCGLLVEISCRRLPAGATIDDSFLAETI